MIIKTVKQQIIYSNENSREINTRWHLGTSIMKEVQRNPPCCEK